MVFSLLSRSREKLLGALLRVGAMTRIVEFKQIPKETTKLTQFNNVFELKGIFGGQKIELRA